MLSMRRALPILALLPLLIWACVGVVQAADKPAPIKALIITGDDVGVHPWREISEATRKALVDSGRFEVKVCEDPLILESAQALKNYDVIVFTIFFTNKTPPLTPLAQENLLHFVKGGKGFFVQHLASASCPTWKEWGNLCGRKWIMGTSGHGPRSVFESKIVDKEHPITQGLEDFKTDDELYAKLQGDTPIQVLVEAYSDWSKKTEPLVFVQEYGKGRVVHNAYGHDGKALSTPCVVKIIARGAEWAATGKVAGK
jgi:type 1 glutamine amidotransferase